MKDLENILTTMETLRIFYERWYRRQGSNEAFLTDPNADFRNSNFIDVYCRMQFIIILEISLK